MRLFEMTLPTSALTTIRTGVDSSSYFASEDYITNFFRLLYLVVLLLVFLLEDVLHKYNHVIGNSTHVELLIFPN